MTLAVPAEAVPPRPPRPLPSVRATAGRTPTVRLDDIGAIAAALHAGLA